MSEIKTLKYKKTLRIAGICIICWLYALAFAALASSCSGEDESAGKDLSADCQAAYAAYLKQVDALPAEEVKQITATTGMSLDEAKKISRQMYADMSDADWQQSWEKAIAWQPTHLCEMGADITTLLHQRGEFGNIVAGLEATGSGVNRLGDIQPGYPIFNWDDLPVKEGLHNRHMVGLTAWHTFFQTTHLTLHEKKVLVIGYGLVGQGVAAAAKAFGGQVMVAEIDPARRLQAAYDGWHVVDLQEAIASADVVATATGGKNVVNRQALDRAKAGVFILNVGHVAEEIDGEYLRQYPQEEVMPYINAYRMADKTVYLLANGSMLNLTAGFGDSLNAFDVTLAVMASGIRHIVTDGMRAPAKVYLLPQAVWQQAL